MAENIDSRRLTSLLIIALLLVFGGGALASYVQTNGGTVTIQDVRFTGTNGTLMSGLLYIPSGVTKDKPAPGVLAVHGYINSRETQDGFAIEFARRGYVVLALDQTGHGYSDPPAFSNGYGGPDGLRFLRSLDIVDVNNIGLEGHSMGGWTSLMAADALRDGYKSIVLEGSSTGAPFAPEGSTTWPRNVALVYADRDEFVNLMWATDTHGFLNADKLKALFGTTEAVIPGQLYGSIQDGTARQLYYPKGTHPNNHISTEAIGYAIDWLQRTLTGGTNLPPTDQIWYWKEIGTFIAFIGGMMFIFAAGGLLLVSEWFRELRSPLPAFKGATGTGWWVAALITVILSPLTYFWLQNQGTTLFPASAFFPQTITTGIMFWAVGNALISLILFWIWHTQSAKARAASLVDYGVTWERGLNWRLIGKSALLAILIVFGLYMLLAISDWMFKTDFRLWVLALKPMSFFQFHIFLAYLLPFTFYFLVVSTVLNNQLRQVNADGTPMSIGRAMLVNGVLLALGIFLMLLIQYIPWSAGSPLPFAEPLLTIVGIQFVPLLLIIGFILTYFFRKTGHIYLGAFICALFITWYIVAGQAVQFAF